MKGLLGKIRLSRKIVFIMAGVLLFLGAVGGAVLYFFADRVTGTQEAKAEEANGLICNDLRSEILRKKNRYWIRQYVSVDGGDGMTRLKTAMRVALAIQERDKPDLVQVAVLDAKGPKSRADMRGRALGANVLLIAHPEKLPSDLPSAAFAARYSEGGAGPDGLYYGMKVELTEEDVKALAETITTRDLCVDPNAKKEEDDHGAKDGHGEAASGHGEAASGHGEAASGHGEADGHGAPAEGGHDAPAEGGHEAPAEGGHDAAPAEGHGDEHSDAGHAAEGEHVAENTTH